MSNRADLHDQPEGLAKTSPRIAARNECYTGTDAPSKSNGAPQGPVYIQALLPLSHWMAQAQSSDLVSPERPRAWAD